MTAAPGLEDAARFWRVAAALARTPEAACRFGETPRDAVLSRDGATLHRYRATAPAVDAPPLLIVHGLVGRAEVVDLDPERSLIRDLLARGLDPWMIHWGRPTRADRWLRFDDIVLDRLHGFAADVTRATGRRPAVMGVCEGGIFAACLAAVEPEALSALIPAVAPLDTDAAPDAALTRLARSLAPDDLRAVIDALGALPGGAMSAAFQALTPARTLAKYTLDLLRTDGEAGRIAHFLRMERWLADRPDHPAEAAKQLLVDLYGANAFARGVFRLGPDGPLADPARIVAPTLAVLGLRDHLVPPASARGLAGRTAGPYAELAADAGHIGVFVSRRARGAVAAGLAAFLTSQAVRAASRV